MHGWTLGRSELVEVANGCACKHLRCSARAVTRLHDETLRPSGLRITQFTLLIAVAIGEPVPITRLADALSLDRTTLGRDLKPLTDRGLVEIRAGDDRRTRVIRLTGQGRDALGRAYPLWQSAQARIVEQSPWPVLAAGLQEVTAAARAN
jgi:DNA-binding MarR family transcriptional regulator